MSDISDQEIIAFVDDRLAEPARTRLAARLVTDADLARRVAEHRWLARQIVAAFGEPPESESDIPALAQLGLGDRGVVPVRRKAQWWRRPINTVSLAAALVMAMLIGRWSATDPGLLLRSNSNGEVIASGTLAKALSQQLSGSHGAVSIGMTIRTANGVCRTFRTAPGLTGLACREGKGWTIPIVEHGASNDPAGHEYQLAGGDTPVAIMDEVDRRRIGEPLDKREEEALRQQDWALARSW